ncbi:MAG: glycosyltransferase family A protein [Pseudomonadota bacterium]
MKTGTYDLRLDRPELAGLRLVLCNRSLRSNGDLESAFLQDVTDLNTHAPSCLVAEALRRAAQRPGTDAVAVIRNPDLVLDPDLPDRLAESLQHLADVGPWALAAAGGLGLSDRRHLALYASLNPAIPLPGGPQPIIDPMPDLYLADAAFLREALSGNTLPENDAVETILTVEGYLAGRLSIFLPGLWAGIDGKHLARDIRCMGRGLTARFGERLAGQTIPTLSGAVELSAQPDDQAAPHFRAHICESVDAAVRTAAQVPSISIVTRTRFERSHLLDRLLTSIARARRDDVTLEVVLATDVDADQAQDALGDIRARHPVLDIRLAVSTESGPSRVANLITGLHAARHDYIAIVDDDDYLDLFAFEHLLPATFLGNRPVIIAGSQAHQERWEVPDHGPAVLTHDEPAQTYPASGWLRMFGGANALPICAALMPRDFVLRRLDAVTLTHDLSEDYALFLLLLTAPDLPAVHELDDTFCHISLRGTENSVTMVDRRPWVRDIAGHLGRLTTTRRVAGPGVWALLAKGRSVEAGASTVITDLKRSLTHCEADIRLLQRENARLRAEIERSVEVTP